MKIWERLLLVFLALVSIAVLGFFAFSVWNPTALLVLLYEMQQSVYLKIAFSALAFVFAVLSVRIMFAGLGGNAKTVTMAASTEAGGIYINIDTISDLASKAVRKVEGIREIRIRTTMQEGGAYIAVKISMASDCVIPEVSAQVQQSVKTDVEGLCGITVKKVVVQVDNSLQSQKN